MPAPVTLRTSDGLALAAELAVAAESPRRARCVLCHPHPLYGGDMYSIVIGALFEALPRLGVTCLRFDFRGAGRSEGVHAGGDLERLDVHAALDSVEQEAPAGTPIVLAGWSFGADVALSVDDPRIAAWLAVAPPLRYGRDLEAVAHDARPKRFVLAQHDEIRTPAEVEAEVAQWECASTVVVTGASHFFIGRTDHVVAAATDLFDTLTAGPAS